MTRGTVSCVIPTHNRDVLLVKALESIRMQTRTPDEVFVVDDTGSESTRILVDSFEGLPHLSYVDNSGAASRGASSSRNAGAAAATSQFVAFLDDDDRWEPGFLAECLALLESSPAQLATVPGTVEVGARRAARPWLGTNHLTPAQCVAWNPGITGSSFVVSLAAFHDISGFDDQLPVFNDLDFFVRFLRRGHRYTVASRPLFIQTADGREHLSSRSERRAIGIRAYMEKHNDELGWRQRRMLLREVHLARRFEGQTRPRRMYHFALMWLHSTPGQFADVVAARLSGRRKMYA